MMTDSDHHHDISDFRKNKAWKYDTKSKIIIILLLIVVSLLIISFEQLLIIYLMVFYFMYIWKVSVPTLLKKALVPIPIIISLSLLTYFSSAIDTILVFGVYAIEYSRLELTIFLFLRGLVIVFGSISLVDSEESFFEIIYAFEELGMPDILISILMLMYRSSLDLYVEAKRMIDVRYSRSTYKRWGTNLYTYRIIGYMIGGILVRAFQNKDKRAETLYSRSFTGKLYHKPKSFRFSGLFLLWISTIAFIVVLLSTNLRFFYLGTTI